LAFFGFSILCVFISCYTYLINTFERYAASALVSISVVRYVAGGAMVVVGIPMYRNLGVHHALTILAALSVPVTALPYVFYVFGSRIRKMSRYAPNKM